LACALSIEPVTREIADDTVFAVLRIPRIALEVPVNAGTGAQVLLRGAGLIAGTAAPGTAGNVAIAAHRDSFFRGLKDVELGDLVELDTREGTWTYRVTALWVVEPNEVQVIADTGEPVLTLVTCYPFYFVGHAPRRFIVRATAEEHS
jgi:sortase A